jgi:hypothetical protein
MPRKNKPTAPGPQAPQLNWHEIGKSLRALGQSVVGQNAREGIHKLQQLIEQPPETFQRGSNPSLYKMAETLQQHRSGRLADLIALVRDRSTPAPVQQKRRMQRRVEIPHVDEAIDQMLVEREANPAKFPFWKSLVERVVVILKKQHHETVANEQKKTLGRRIKERMAMHAARQT